MIEQPLPHQREGSDVNRDICLTNSFHGTESRVSAGFVP